MDKSDPHVDAHASWRMASEAPVPAAGISSLFKKKKGKKTKGSNLNNDSGLPKTEEKPKIEKLQEILGGPDPADDDGWADVVEKKSVVATGGKQVSDLINMTALMTEDESTAAKLEKQDIKQAFHDARTVKEVEKKEDTPEEKEEKGEDAPKPKGLSGDIFGGAAARGGAVGALGGGWKKRMEERQLKQRQEELSVENTSAFPSLKDAMSAPVKPKQSAPEPDANRWVRRTGGGGSAAAAAIKAALGRAEEDQPAAAPAPPTADGAVPAAAPPAAPSAEESKATEPVWVAPVKKSGGAAESGADGAAPAAAPAAVEAEAATVVAVEAEEEPVVVETDKAALVQQFGKKKVA
eukprot:g6258.t1